jgi:hypothetical protein
MSFLFLTKMKNRRAEQILCGRLILVGDGRIWGEGVGG